MNQFDPFGQDLGLLKSLEDEVVSELEELSRRLMNGLFVLIRSAWLYGLENDTLKIAEASFRQILGDFETRGQEVVELRLRDESFFINGQLVKLDFSTYQSSQKLRKLFEVFQLDEMIFPLPVDEHEIAKFSQILNTVANSNQKFADLAHLCTKIVASKMDDLELEVDTSLKDPRQEILKLYSHGLLTLKFFVDDLKRGVRPKYSKIKRLCLKLMQLESKYQNLILAVVHIHSVKGLLHTHMLNTAILCLIFARRVGLSKKETLDLGMTAFYQNLSWALVDKVHPDAAGISLETIHEIQSFRNDHRESIQIIRNHVSHLLLMIGGFNTQVINRLIVAYETQVVSDEDLESLYLADIDANLLTEIVSMASQYDRLTGLHDDGKEVRTDVVLKEIVDQSAGLHPFLAQLFVSTFGTYPIGSLVELSDGRLGVVFDLPESLQHSNRPRVKLVADRNGTAIEDGDVLDLADRSSRGDFLHSIEHVYRGSDFGLSVANFFFGSVDRSSIR